MPLHLVWLDFSHFSSFWLWPPSFILGQKFSLSLNFILFVHVKVQKKVFLRSCTFKFLFSFQLCPKGKASLSFPCNEVKGVSFLIDVSVGLNPFAPPFKTISSLLVLATLAYLWDTMTLVTSRCNFVHVPPLPWWLIPWIWLVFKPKLISSNWFFIKRFGLRPSLSLALPSRFNHSFGGQFSFWWPNPSKNLHHLVMGLFFPKSRLFMWYNLVQSDKISYIFGIDPKVLSTWFFVKP